MKFSMNYSLAAADLLADEAITLDLFKTPGWPDLVGQALEMRPVAVHFNLEAGSGRLVHSDWSQVDNLLPLSSSPLVNLHFEPRAEDYPGVPLQTHDTDHISLMLERTIADVQAAVERFGVENVILENTPFPAMSVHILQAATQPAAICQVVEETGCGLLLDISHARIAAHSLEMDEQEYLAALPVDRLRELHITGVHPWENGLRDHLPMLEQDWLALDWVFGRIRDGDWAPAWMLAFEYGGVGEKFAWRSDPQVIASQAPRLYEMVHAV